MNDRELLELAAKACDYDTSHRWNTERLTMNPVVNGLAIGGVSTNWNPLENDGDALRLSVYLKLRIDHFFSGEQKVMVGNGGLWAIESYNGCARTATRRAIVRAAAQTQTQQQ